MPIMPLWCRHDRCSQQMAPTLNLVNRLKLSQLQLQLTDISEHTYSPTNNRSTHQSTDGWVCMTVSTHKQVYHTNGVRSHSRGIVAGGGGEIASRNISPFEKFSSIWGKKSPILGQFRCKIKILRIRIASVGKLHLSVGKLQLLAHHHPHFINTRCQWLTQWTHDAATSKHKKTAKKHLPWCTVFTVGRLNRIMSPSRKQLVYSIHQANPTHSR